MKLCVGYFKSIRHILLHFMTIRVDEIGKNIIQTNPLQYPPFYHQIDDK